MILHYGNIDYFKEENYNIIQYNDLDIELYSNKLKNFNLHDWVEFYENKKGQPNIKFAEGCYYKGIKGLEEFEKNVLKQYGYNKNNFIYRIYMLEADKMRLALNLKTRQIGKNMNINELLEKKSKRLSVYVVDIMIEEGTKNSNYYSSKNILWCLEALKNINNDAFKYLEDYHSNYYYDLVTVNYLEKDFAIPVPILVEIIKVDEKIIYNCFTEHLDRNEEEFI